MKITFLGTSHGLIEKGREFSSTMIEVNGSIYFIDAGASIASEIINRDKKYEDVKAVFITHAHGDHVGSLFSFVNLANWYYKKSNFSVYLPEQPVIDAFKELIAKTDDKIDENRIKFIAYDETTFYQDENIKVTFLPTKHLKWMNRPAYSIIVETKDKRLVFSGDLSGGLKENDFPSIVMEKETDLFVLELAHFDFKDTVPYLKKCKTKRVCFNHVGLPHSKFDDIKEGAKDFAFPISAVFDGDEIEI